jgi:hypothetical protein
VSPRHRRLRLRRTCQQHEVKNGEGNQPNPARTPRRRIPETSYILTATSVHISAIPNLQSISLQET